MTHPVPSTTSDAPAWRRPAIIGGVIALAVLAGLLLAIILTREPETASGDLSPSASPSPSAQASPSDDPAPSEEPAPSEAPSAPAEPTDESYLDPVVANPDDVLPPGGVVRVTADSLNVREQPILDSPEQVSVGQGELLVVGPTFGYGAFGPAMEDGYTWYPVGTIGLDELPAPGGAPIEILVRGWVAIGDGESEWLELLAPRCTDDEPTLQHLSSLTEWERLACYGDRQLTFEGVLGCPGCGGLYPGTFTPEWLAFPSYSDPISVEPQDSIGPMDLHWSPDGQARPNTDGIAPILRVTGHFDDPAAEGCSIVFMAGPASGIEESEVDPAISELFCRTNFVVDSYEVIGEDEDFPFA